MISLPILMVLYGEIIAHMEENGRKVKGEIYTSTVDLKNTKSALNLENC